MTETAQPQEAPPVEPVRASGIEQRSIDWVPGNERHGKVSTLGAIWFVTNVNLTGLATGVATLAVGAGLFWTLVATVVGSAFGTFFMAFHSAQGPHLGLPQLVQSRPQFGYLGAALTVWVFALVNYLAYNTSDALLSGAATNTLFSVPDTVGYLGSAAVAAVLALYGYRWIHRVERLLTWPLVAVLVLLAVAVLAHPGSTAQAWRPGDFALARVMTVFVIVAGFQLGWAPYVSDYSRYLPANVGVRATFWWTYLPSAVSAVWVFVLGSAVAAVEPEQSDPVTAFKAVGDSLAPGLGWAIVLLLFLGLLAIMAINQYGGSLGIISIMDSFRPVAATRRLRVAAIAAMAVAVFVIAQAVGADRFNEFYGNALVFLAYLFTPWTAINLVDFFFVRRGTYVIAEIFKRDGIYGLWGGRGITAYLVALAAMAPFFVTEPFTGPAARALGNVDYSMFVGLPVAAVAYWALCRNLDLAHERELAAAEGATTRL
ncbi:purine-cytosine permease family protein [Embleya sp. NPDC056575]|uniref:purine-cytosine permease family protein n=1 Tax=unclassified Embleya TaxID=2699296 RepID=UPI00369814AA